MFLQKRNKSETKLKTETMIRKKIKRFKKKS